MTPKDFNFNIKNNNIPKYQQLVDFINDAIAKNLLKKGSLLPSVTSVCLVSKISRNTVFKAYSILKNQGVIDSVSNKGYYILGNTRNILLILDDFNAYKEVLYQSFVNNLPDNFVVDVQFHHFNIDNFKSIVNNSLGKYYKYVVMNFDNQDVASVLKSISNDKLLLIDRNIHSNSDSNYVFQDFGKAFYTALVEAVALFRKYKSIDFVYPSFAKHPVESILYFKKFCKEFQFDYKIITNLNQFKIEKNKAYICVDDRLLGEFLEQCKDKNFELGVDVGFLSYNETPMKKFIYKGISVVSIDFNEFGNKGAEFIIHDTPIQFYLPTKLLLRKSL